jgi:hypothetical protein
LDLDCPEAIQAAELLAPATGWIFGRKSRRRSHRCYVVADPGSRIFLSDPLLENRGDDEKAMLVELRADGCQTIFPPGHHPSGEKIDWDECTQPGSSEWSTLSWITRQIAVVALLARYWPSPGSRHQTALAIGGALSRTGMTVEDACRLMKAICEVANDAEVNDRIKAIESSYAKLVVDEPTTGWPELERLLGEDKAPVVTRVREWVGGPRIRFGSGGQLSLPVDAPWPGPLAPEALYGLVGDVVRVLEPASEADPVAILLQTLVGFGSIVGRTVHCVVEADRHYGNEFLGLVGRTSKARKGTSWGRVREVLRAADEEWVEHRIESGLSSAEGLIWAVRDQILKRERVKERGEPVRYEEVEADPGISDKRVLVVEPELANVLKQTERQGNTLSVVLRQGWDGLDLRTLTKNNPARATSPHISLIGHITGEELRRYLSTTEMANGFANRFFFACVDRSKRLPRGGQLDETALADVQARLLKAVEVARDLDELTFDPQAGEIWDEVYGDLSDGCPGLIGALLGRAEAHVLRLSLLYAALDGAQWIETPHLMAALAVWTYCEQSLLYIFGDAIGDPVADELLRILRASADGMTRNQICDHFGRHQSSDRIGRALAMLAEHRLARYERQETGGRPREIWRAVGR